jgi:DNA-binding Lrp family transcriptional regulator
MNQKLRKKNLKTAYIQGIYSNNTSIDQILKIKKQTTKYILNGLLASRMYFKKRYVIDLNALNLGKFAWFFISVNWEKFDSKDFMSKLMKIQKIHTIAEVTGPYDLAIKIIGSSIQDVNNLILTIEKTFPEIIDTDVHFMSKEYKVHFEKITNPTQYKLKKLDYLLLAEKDQAPDLNFQTLAKKHSLHRNTISNKWNKLWTEKVIIKSTIELAPEGYNLIGLGLKAFIIIKPASGKQELIIKKVIKNNEIQDIFTTLENEIGIIVRVANSDELAAFHRHLSKTCPNIKSTNTIIFLTKITKTGLNPKEIDFLFKKN